MPTPAEVEFQANMQDGGNQFPARTLRNIGMAGVGAFGLLAAIRGLKGLGDVWSGSHAPPPTLPTRQQFLTVPVPRREKRAGPYQQLAAGCAAIQKNAASWAPGPGEWTAAKVLDTLGLIKNQAGSNWSANKELFMNHAAKTVQDMPWALPTAVAAIGGGAYLGHTLTDSALNAAKSHETDTELEESKRQYEQALRPKAAAAHPLGDLYDHIEKTAGAPEDPMRAGYLLATALLEPTIEKAAYNIGPLNPLLGMYLTAAGATGLGSGIAAYNWARGHDEQKLVADALKQRRERMFAQGPASLYAVPQEVDPNEPELHPPEPGHFSTEGLRARLQKVLPHKALPHKAAAVGGSADATLSRFKAQRQQLAQQTAAFLGVEPKPDKSKPAEPQPQPLPSVVAPPPAR
jgi:hypothetical protein